MYTGTFGDVIFSVGHYKVLTPSGIKGSTGADWATHDVLEGKPRSQYIAPKARQYSFDIRLSNRFGVPARKTLRRLQEMAENGEAHYFVMGFSPLSQNRFVIKDISEEWDTVAHLGILYECNVSLTLEEYV